LCPVHSSLPPAKVSFSLHVTSCSHSKNLHRVLTNNPRLSSYVRELYVEEYIHCYGDYWQDAADPEVFVDDSFHKALKMLPHLRLISLVLDGSCLAWEDFSTGLDLALAEVFRLPSLEICILEGIHGFPAEFFRMAVNLKCLYLASASVTSTHPPISSSRKPRLEYLELSNCDEQLETMQTAIDLSRLRHVTMQTVISANSWKTCEQSADSLEMFSWFYCSESTNQIITMRMHMDGVPVLMVNSCALVQLAHLSIWLWIRDNRW